MEFDVEKEWKEFAFTVLPPNASTVQRREMRRAFIAGIASGCNLIERIAKADLPAIEEHQVLQSVSGQLTRIMAGIMSGNDRG
jgi:hypothetical protein